MEIAQDADQARESAGHEDELELALLRRGVAQRVDEYEACGCCGRIPLIGERVYGFASGAIVCELCRPLEREGAIFSRLVHGPAFGNSIRIIDQRTA